MIFPTLPFNRICRSWFSKFSITFTEFKARITLDMKIQVIVLRSARVSPTKWVRSSGLRTVEWIRVIISYNFIFSLIPNPWMWVSMVPISIRGILCCCKRYCFQLWLSIVGPSGLIPLARLYGWYFDTMIGLGFLDEVLRDMGSFRTRQTWFEYITWLFCWSFDNGGDDLETDEVTTLNEPWVPGIDSSLFDPFDEGLVTKSGLIPTKRHLSNRHLVQSFLVLGLISQQPSMLIQGMSRFRRTHLRKNVLCN